VKELKYWIKFDRDDRPYKIIAQDFLDLMDQIRRMTEQRQEPFEWVNRDYK